MKVAVEVDLDVTQEDIPEHWQKADAATMAKIMEPELQAFEVFFRGLGQDPLIGVERTILKTYLAWKLRG